MQCNTLQAAVQFWGILRLITHGLPQLGSVSSNSWLLVGKLMQVLLAALMVFLRPVVGCPDRLANKQSQSLQPAGKHHQW